MWPKSLYTLCMASKLTMHGIINYRINKAVILLSSVTAWNN